MFEVGVGKDGDLAAQRRIANTLMLAVGVATLTVPLNGSSEDRAEQIEHWRAYARSINARFVVHGRCLVVVGGLV